MARRLQTRTSQREGPRAAVSEPRPFLEALERIAASKGLNAREIVEGAIRGEADVADYFRRRRINWRNLRKSCDDCDPCNLRQIQEELPGLIKTVPNALLSPTVLYAFRWLMAGRFTKSEEPAWAIALRLRCSQAIATPKTLRWVAAHKRLGRLLPIEAKAQRLNRSGLPLPREREPGESALNVWRDHVARAEGHNCGASFLRLLRRERRLVSAKPAPANVAEPLESEG